MEEENKHVHKSVTYCEFAEVLISLIAAFRSVSDPGVTQWNWILVPKKDQSALTDHEACFLKLFFFIVFFLL